jgi:hypothetical protein
MWKFRYFAFILNKRDEFSVWERESWSKKIHWENWLAILRLKVVKFLGWILKWCKRRFMLFEGGFFEWNKIRMKKVWHSKAISDSDKFHANFFLLSLLMNYFVVASMSDLKKEKKKTQKNSHSFFAIRC